MHNESWVDGRKKKKNSLNVRYFFFNIKKIIIDNVKLHNLL